MRLGLPDTVRACLFDLDGVLTQTAKVHAAAWKEMFDGFLRGWADRQGQPFQPFDAHDDYDNLRRRQTPSRRGARLPGLAGYPPARGRAR